MATRTIPLNANKFEFMQTLYCTSEGVPVAYAEQVQDRVTGEMQEEVNEGFRENFADLTLSSDDLDAIINEVDRDNKYIQFAVTENGTSVTKTAYRFPSGDVAGSSNARTLCFSTIGGDKYYVAYDGGNGAWSDSTSTLNTGTNVYTSTTTSGTAASTISGGTSGFVINFASLLA